MSVPPVLLVKSLQIWSSQHSRSVLSYQCQSALLLDKVTPPRFEVLSIFCCSSRWFIRVSHFLGPSRCGVAAGWLMNGGLSSNEGRSCHKIHIWYLIVTVIYRISNSGHLDHVVVSLIGEVLYCTISLHLDQPQAQIVRLSSSGVAPHKIRDILFICISTLQ